MPVVSAILGTFARQHTSTGAVKCNLHAVPKTKRYVKYEWSFHSNMLLCPDLNHQFLLQSMDYGGVEDWKVELESISCDVLACNSSRLDSLEGFKP